MVLMTLINRTEDDERRIMLLLSTEARETQMQPPSRQKWVFDATR